MSTSHSDKVLLADLPSTMREVPFGSYVLRRRIATGGMAEIFLAKQTGISGFERLIVIKRILPHLAENREFVTMFMDEARIAGQLNHPNVVQIYDVGKVQDACYIAMEFIHGEDVRKIYNQEVQRANRIPIRFALYLLAQAARGLDYAHRKSDISGAPLGLVHRDVSPQNILVTYDGHVKIVDFGVAKAANKVAQTRSGVLKGKYSYMSPEQAQGLKLDARTDIFALAVVFYEITCGVRLFKRENELETLQAVIGCEVKPPTKIDRAFPPALEKVIMKALAKNPARRQATASEFAQDLEDFARSIGNSIGPSDVASYMQELFADQLAEEVLVGAGLWDEDHTNEGRKAEQKRDRARATPLPHSNESSGHALETQRLERHSLETHGLDKRGLDKRGENLTEDSRRRRALQETLVTDGPDAERSTTGRVNMRDVKSWPIWLALAVSVVIVGTVTLWLSSNIIGGVAESGPIFFDSLPRGATIYLDGARLSEGTTPLLLTRALPTGPHDIKFELDGYELGEGIIRTASSGKNTFYRELRPLLGEPKTQEPAKAPEAKPRRNDTRHR